MSKAVMSPRRSTAVYIGIDPGASGGLVSIVGKSVSLTPMPDTERDIWRWIQARSQNRSPLPFAVIEKVGGYISGNPAPGSAMFRFGQSYGFLKGCLVAAGIPYTEVMPQKWIKGLGIPYRKNGRGGSGRVGGAESKTEFKRRLRQHAEQLYPQERITNATADALLIATYCQRWREGRL